MTDGSNDTERLFLALWPPPALADRIRALADELGISGRRIPSENLHITLAFLGDVATERLPELEAVGAHLSQPGFRLTLDQLGHWRRPRITWLGPSQPPAAATELHDAVQQALATAGFPTSQHAFKPHVTLARKSRPVPLTPIEPIDWWVDRMALVASERHPGGSCYRIRSEWSLAAESGAGV